MPERRRNPHAVALARAGGARRCAGGAVGILISPPMRDPRRSGADGGFARFAAPGRRASTSGDRPAACTSPAASSATAGQTCVVTLEPLTNEVHEEIDLVFMPPPPVGGRRRRGADRPGAETDDDRSPRSTERSIWGRSRPSF